MVLQLLKLSQNRSDYMPRKKNFNIEDDLQQIDFIISKMENEDISFDNSLKLYENGLKLINNCMDKLNNIKEKVYVLENDFTLKNFDKDGE